MALKNTDITIRNATHNDIEEALQLLKANFLHDSILVWIIEDDDLRSEAFEPFFRMYVTAGVNEGVVTLAEAADGEMVGAAVWLPHDINTDEEVEMLVSKYTTNFTKYYDIMYRHFPPVESFYQLATTAVKASAHGLGIGSLMLAHQLNEYDKLGISTYLEATTRRVAGGLYTRQAYQPIGQVINFPNGAEAYPMWRPAKEPQTAPSTSKQVAIRKHYPILESIIRFGNQDWRVIDVQDDKALLISEHVLEVRAFHEQHTPITWSDSTLRAYLNHEFYNTFTAEEKAKILPMPITNYNNPWFGTDCGPETVDHLFLLSAEGVVRYFGDSKQLRAKNINSKYFINDYFNEARKATLLNGESAGWWLRTSGNLSDLAAFVTDEGRVSMSGDFVHRSNEAAPGVRPLFWLEL